MLVDAIKLAGDEELKKTIINSLGYKKPSIPVGLKYIFIFLCVLTGAMTLWNYIGPENGYSNYHHNLINLFRIKNASTQEQQQALTTQPVKHNSKEAFKDSVPAEESQPASEELTQSISDSSEGNSSPENIIVKKDQLLISHIIRAVNVDVEKSSSSEGINVSEKLNPEGGLPDDIASPVEYIAEFWVSPVNYKGYRLIKNKIILFGIDEPDEVGLFTKDGKLWLKYKHDFFILNETDNFESFIQTAESPLVKR
jgi:hypothetical protein